MMNMHSKRWPHPTVRVSISDVADLLEINRTSLAKPIKRIRDGKPHGTTVEAIATAAEIFHKHAEGATPRVGAELLINALNIPPSRVDQSPPMKDNTPREIRQRLSKKEGWQLHNIPENRLYDIFQEAADRVATRNNPNARKRLGETIEAMVKREIAFPVSVIRGEGVKPEHFKPFGTIADWISKAGPQDFRLFVFIEGKGRPIDYPLAPRRALRNAKIVFLTLSDWLEKMSQGFNEEYAVSENTEIAKATGKAMKPSKGPLRS